MTPLAARLAPAPQDPPSLSLLLPLPYAETSAKRIVCMDGCNHMQPFSVYFHANVISPPPPLSLAQPVFFCRSWTKHEHGAYAYVAPQRQAHVRYLTRVEVVVDDIEDVGGGPVPQHRGLHPVQVLLDQVRKGR